ncbi:expressed unknown protein [Seminavis robusta]|uniref:Uncharacterized protein n=1 Tax=Seminavis robusta TaxID=568900 RepID=A0A9N8DQ45_9STRA|nr:expressed unknown protein [Seminavis robusta]|eukprot:Sro292_g109570.1 n/a (269) ;mRNA; f:12995-13892
MATEQQRRLEQRGSVCYRDHADATHERHSDGGRDDCEEREPLMNESAPLRFSQEREEGRCDGSTANFTTAATRLGDDNVRPLTCRVMVDNDVQKPGRISLAGLVRNKPGALSSSTPNPGDVTSIDRRMQSLAVAQQQARKHAQKLIKDKSVATRRRILMNTLGMQKFYKALALIREVKGIRENLLRSCAAEDPLSKSAARGKIRVCKQKFEALPKPGRDLLSKTDLVASLERTELDRLGKLRWDELIQQAQENLFAYREWVSISETRE